VPRLVVRPLQQFLRLEVSGGVLLLAATVAALLWANAAGATYDDFWSTGVTLRAGDYVLAEDLRHLVNDGLMAIFALANAGIVFDGASLEAATETRVALAVALGLVIGKTVGITAGVALATRLGLSALPPGVGWAQMAGAGTVAGIGFTVSLFISDLSYADPGVLAAAKMGVLAGSVVAAAAGIAILLAAHRRAQRGRRLSR
jgi:Na+/H+ antiporter NhaA